jgi:hypothetical protein
VILSSLTGCATTHAISFAASEQPQGDYKYTVISAASFSGSVLQHFYSEYPSGRYEVVTCELKSKNYLSVLVGLGSGLLGALISTAIATDTEDLAAGMAVGLGVPLITFSEGCRKNIRMDVYKKISRRTLSAKRRES